MSDESALDVVREAIERVGRLDIDGALELVTDDLILELPFRGDGGPRRLEGDDAKVFMRALPKLLSGLDFHDIVIHGQLPNGTVLAEYRAKGVTKRGRPYPNAYVALFELRDGRISRWREYFDPNVVAAAFDA